MGRKPGNATGEHEITWQCLEEQEEEEINVKLLSNSPSAVRSRRNRPPSRKVRENLENAKQKNTSQQVEQKLKQHRKICNKVSESEGANESANEVQDTGNMEEKLQEKDSIINNQLKEIENLREELREARQKERKHDEESKTILATLLHKEEVNRKLNEKISALKTKDLKGLKDKFVKKTNQQVQTEEIETNIANSLTILDKLPCMNRNAEHETNKKLTGRKFLNINVTRGKKDKCFNCFDLENKLSEITKNNNQLKRQVVEYQEKMGTKSSGEEKPKESEHMEKQGSHKHQIAISETRGSPLQHTSTSIQPEEPTSVTRSEQQTEREAAEAGHNAQKGEGMCCQEDEVERRDPDDGNRDNEIKGSECENIIEAYFREGNRIEEYFRERELKRNKRTQEAKKEKLDDQLTGKLVSKEKSGREKTDGEGDKHKDMTPLCNRYVGTGECWRRGCRYTHKRLCRRIERDGICTKVGCWDGHNTGGICRYYNNGGCRYSRETCRYVHIKIKLPDTKKESRWETTEEDADSRRPGDNRNKDGRNSNNSEERESVDMEGLEQVVEDDRNSDEFILYGGEWYCDSLEEDKIKEDEEHDDDNISKLNCENQAIQNKPYEENILIERDLGHFLRVDRRHDIWDRIQATKAEIKELERSMQGTKRKRCEGQNQ